ncbi:PREDICTED: protein ripply1 [Elephantulus edwardii]|uniref:protein ripply1 n=1 Tax=Elephantulus edwardii TaxID=28737 RepID=UPI0003F0DE2D|nr:PREDICTED: protein ripply1 [Elephantulus edwardii]
MTARTGSELFAAQCDCSFTIFPLCPRGLPFWRPWLSTNDLPRQVRKVMELDTNGTTAGQVLKANSKFSHPVRLFWPKSRSFDYLYQDGEILLQNFPVQATINVYEDSDSEEEEEDKAKEEKEEADVKDPEECVRFLEYVPCRTTAQPPSPSLTCLN